MFDLTRAIAAAVLKFANLTISATIQRATVLQRELRGILEDADDIPWTRT